MQLRLRPISAHDEPFLQRLYASTRADELALVDWSDEQKTAFVLMQFAAQHRYYQQQFAHASFDIIECSDGPIGRLYVDRRPDELRIIDIALLPEHRGHGVGSHYLRHLIDEADRADLPLRIHVERTNPALRLYTRLGFVPIGDHGIYLLLERRSSHAGTSDQRDVSSPS